MADSMLDFLLCAGRLKRTPRTGWVMRNVDRPESVAEHQFRLALMAMSLADKFGGAGVIDRDRAIRMCLVRFFQHVFLRAH
jgi:putative hydrolase of HD superfamily